MELSRKQIAFDLSQDELKKHYGKNHENAYRDLKVFFKNNDWEHNQGSVYTSKNPLTNHVIQDLVKRAVYEMPWFGYSVKKMNVTDIGNFHDLEEAVLGAVQEIYGATNQDLELSAEQKPESEKTLEDIKDEITKKQPSTSGISNVVDKAPLGRGGLDRGGR